MSYHNFGLTLMVTHACNMRCTYCYTGEKAPRRMPPPIAHAAIRRAIASTAPNGHLDIGFFGGEPLLESANILHWIDLARAAADHAGINLSFHLTTNGTLTTPAAWKLLTQSDVRVAVSCDGLPPAHDRFRLFADGTGTSATVQHTLQRLLALDKPLSVVMVVRPETVPHLAAGIRHLRSLGVRSIEPSLDLWTHWSPEDAAALRRSIAQAADLWQQGLPDHALNWFDDKAVELAGLPSTCTRCHFGDGELAIAPSGNLYPCERLIGEDRPDNPSRLPGHVLDTHPDFSPQASPPGQQADACHACSMRDLCNTSCRCSNFIRTGDTRHPDGLLCMLNQACLEEVLRLSVPCSGKGPLSMLGKQNVPTPQTSPGAEKHPLHLPIKMYTTTNLHLTTSP